MKRDMIKIVQDELAANFADNRPEVVKLVDTDCVGLFDEFGRRLSRLHSQRNLRLGD